MLIPASFLIGKKFVRKTEEFRRALNAKLRGEHMNISLRQASGRIAEIAVVENVEALHAKLQRTSLGELRAFIWMDMSTL